MACLGTMLPPSIDAHGLRERVLGCVRCITGFLLHKSNPGLWRVPVNHSPYRGVIISPVIMMLAAFEIRLRFWDDVSVTCDLVVPSKPQWPNAGCGPLLQT